VFNTELVPPGKGKIDLKEKDVQKRLSKAWEQ
jgi:hypothetical protein